MQSILLLHISVRCFLRAVRYSIIRGTHYSENKMLSSFFTKISFLMNQKTLHFISFREALSTLKGKLSELFDVRLSDKIDMFSAQYKYTG